MEDLELSPEDKKAIEDYCKEKIVASMWSYEVNEKKNTLTIKPNQTEGGCITWEFLEGLDKIFPLKYLLYKEVVSYEKQSFVKVYEIGLAKPLTMEL